MAQAAEVMGVTDLQIIGIQTRDSAQVKASVAASRPFI
jgi:hypothetical protein